MVFKNFFWFSFQPFFLQTASIYFSCAMQLSGSLTLIYQTHQIRKCLFLQLPCTIKQFYNYSRLKKHRYNLLGRPTFFKNTRFMPSEMLQSILIGFFEKRKSTCFYFMQICFFPLINDLVYVDKDQGIHLGKKQKYTQTSIQ